MNPHFVEILKAFRDESVEYLLIGAHALAAHGHVRATLDIDLWVKPTPENALRRPTQGPRGPRRAGLKGSPVVRCGDGGRVVTASDHRLPVRP
jgi:hypothetical protein